MIEMFVPGSLRNPLNGSFSRAHWSVRSRWSNDWKRRTQVAWIGGHPPPTSSQWCERPKVIAFTAQTGATWDDDNLRAALKPVRDALIGYVIHSDAPNSGHVFEYAQVVNRKARGVRITISPRTP